MGMWVCVSWFLQAGVRVFSPAKAKIARLVLRGPAMFEPCRAGRLIDSRNECALPPKRRCKRRPGLSGLGRRLARHPMSHQTAPCFVSF